MRDVDPGVLPAAAGEPGFQSSRQRDAKKRELCLQHGVETHEVRFDEDIGKRARQVAQIIELRLSGSGAQRTTPAALGQG